MGAQGEPGLAGYNVSGTRSGASPSHQREEMWDSWTHRLGWGKVEVMGQSTHPRLRVLPADGGCPTPT